jgi:hypothetical protein
MTDDIKHVIDTNVLLVASAAHPGSPLDCNVTPIDDPNLRREVLNWLEAFEISDEKIVLDWEWKIVAEYKGENRRHKLSEQDYGLLVVLHKYSTNQFQGVELQWNEPDSASIHDPVLHDLIQDHADRKMVAAALACGGGEGGCDIVNSCDTDWYDWQGPLETSGVFVHQIIGEQWCYPKWMEKQAR